MSTNAKHAKHTHHGGGGKTFKKFCAFCKAKGLPEAVFTSHFVKDKPGCMGKVVCPELLKNVCADCGEKGHTPKECPAPMSSKTCRYCHESGHSLHVWEKVERKSVRKTTCPKILERDARRADAKKAKKQSLNAPTNADGFMAIPTRKAGGGGCGCATPFKGWKTTNPFAGLDCDKGENSQHVDVPTPAVRAPLAPQGVWAGVGHLSIAQLENILQAGDAEVAKILAQKKASAKPKEAKPKEAEPKEAKPKEAEPKEAEPKEAEPKEAEPKEAEPVTTVLINPAEAFGEDGEEISGRWGVDATVGDD